MDRRERPEWDRVPGARAPLTRRQRSDFSDGPEGARLAPGISPRVVVAVGGCAQYVGPTGHVDLGGAVQADSSNPCFSHGASPPYPPPRMGHYCLIGWSYIINIL